jgi:putative membrane protein
LVVAALLGFALVVFLIVESGAADVARAMLVVGWWLVPITLYHVVPMFFSALSWRELLPLSSRPDIANIVLIRWIRESINSLLPVSGVGGDFASVRLANLRGVPGVEAAASMVVDTTVGIATQLIFVLTGVVLLATRSNSHDANVVASATLLGAGVFVVVIGAFLLAQHRSMFAMFARFAHGLLPEKWLAEFSGNASAIDGAVVAAYRAGAPFWRANVFRLIGWAAGVGETWLVLQALGQPLGIVDAFVLESLGSGVRAAAFIVPGALGVLEGGFVLFGSLYGLPADAALAVSLSKRVREIGLGLPGLFVWQWLEGRNFLRHRERAAR